MSSINRVFLVGHLGSRPELKRISGGRALCELRVATTETFLDKQDKKQEHTEWHRVVVWGRDAERCVEHLDKGRQVVVEGRLQTRSWTDERSGEKRHVTEIVATRVTFLGPGGRPNRSPTTAYDAEERR